MTRPTGETGGKRGVYPGSFDPLTVAHLAIAEAARAAADLDRLDLAISRAAMGKEPGAQSSVDRRVTAIERAAETRPWLGARGGDDQLVADLARGYDAVVVGADKWAQMRDPAWYGGSEHARDDALSQLPRVLVAPRPGFDADVVRFEQAEVLMVDPELAHVSSSAARAGAHHLIAPEARDFVAPRARRRLIVDGSNVIGSKPDGWWRDRTGAIRRLVAALPSYAARTGDQVAVVLDGRPLPDLPEGVHDGVLVAYAQRAGRDAADDRIVAEVARDADPGSLTVVTSDHGLAERVRALGARVEGAASFRREMESERH